MLASFGKIPVRQSSLSRSVAAPLGGWNARDALGEMDKLDAVTLENWWPGTSDVILRKGYTQYATGIGAQVETLIPYVSGNTTKLFAAASTFVYDVTSGGAVGTASVSSLTNARWQYTNITTAGGSYISMVNGADKMRTFDGTNWHADGDGAPYDVTNVNTNTATNITLFKNRIWFTVANSLKLWYLPINSIGGAALSLDMSSLAQNGGYLMAVGTWTLDAGYGVDDNLVCISSTGEVFVWRLTDPTTPTGIALIGVFQIGSPIGRRCMMKYSGDMLIITQDGVTPLAQGLQSSRLDPRVNITDKIQFAVSQAISTYSSNFGWQLTYFPKENQLYLNVPISEGSMQEQYVMNTITKSWCNFSGWAANCFVIYRDDLYYGGNGFVAKAWNGNVDNVNNIEAIGLQSFQYYGGATQKQCMMIRPHFLTNGSPGVYGNVNVDYNLSDTSTTLSFAPTSYATWGSATWGTSLWGGDDTPAAEWQGATAIGYCFAPFLKTASQGINLRWVSTDLVFQVGGTL